MGIKPTTILLALFLGACSATQIQDTAAAVQAACAVYEQAKATAVANAKGGAANTVSSITAYGDPICQSASAAAQYAADPTTAAYLGALSQQLKSAVPGS